MNHGRFPRLTVTAWVSRLTVVVLAIAAVVLAGHGAAAAAPPPAGSSPAGSGSYVRLAHLSPNTPNVDVYLASVGDPRVWFTVPGVGYGSVTEYRAIPADTYAVSMRAAGAPADSPPVITTSLTTAPGAAYTVAGTGLSADLGLAVLDDELRIPPAGTARIRVINGAATAPTVDMSVVGGPRIAEKLAFTHTTAYQSVPIGRWTVEASTPGRATPVELAIDVADNAVYTALLLDAGGTVKAELQLDSAGAAAVPRGGIDTGFGGTAPLATTPAR